jgi:nitroreductase
MYREEVRDFVGLPPEGKVLGLFYLGYPEGEWPQSHRRPLEYVTTWVE